MNNNKKERKQQEQQRHSNSEITRGKKLGDRKKTEHWRQQNFIFSKEVTKRERVWRRRRSFIQRRRSICRHEMISERTTKHGNLLVQLDTCLHWFFNSCTSNSHGLFSPRRWCDEHFFLSWANREMCCEIEIDRLIDINHPFYYWNLKQISGEGFNFSRFFAVCLFFDLLFDVTKWKLKNRYLLHLR